MKSIGKYQVVEELGVSPTGKTYRVRDGFRNREFAVKILQTVPGLSAEAKEQFCGHLAACAELAHRHIAKVYDLGEVEEGIFVATEWRAGTDLRKFIEDNQGLPLGQKLAVIAQVAEGLAFAHSRGIAHGNLKPSNIFVDGARDVSILDFGIAKWLAALLKAGNRPEGLMANYLAPEQVLGQPFTARSDIFALGLMLYEFASGKYPFSADPGLVPREIVHTEPEPLGKLDAQVPEELEQLVARTLKKDPEQRLQTAEEFASGLYLAAQQLRRIASAAAPTGPPPSTEQVPIATQVPAAFTADPLLSQPVLSQPVLSQPVMSQPVIPQPVFSQSAPLQPVAPTATPASPMSMEPAAHPVPAPKVRQRPQDAEPAQQPWTARSYATRAPLPPVAELPKEPAVSTPAFVPPKSFLKPEATALPPFPVIGPPKGGKLKKRLLTAAVGLILAVGIVGSLISRQNLRASQSKAHAATPVVEPAAPVAKPPSPPSEPTPAAHAPKPGESGPDDLGNPEFSARQTLNGPVRTSWESGKYAQALALVNQVLANDPTNDEARAWRKRIREAQAAEAALK